jgi:hypothetical protein
MFGDGEWTQYIFIALIIAYFIWRMSRRSKRSGNTNLDIAADVLSNVNDNLKIVEERASNWGSKKKFQTASWNRSKEKVGFLGTELVSKLNESFALAEDFNSRIDSARKNNIMSTLQDMPLDRLREPLTKSKEGLVAWLQTNYQSEAMNSQNRGCSGM